MGGRHEPHDRQQKEIIPRLFSVEKTIENPIYQATEEKEFTAEYFLKNFHRMGHLSILESTKIRRVTYSAGLRSRQRGNPFLATCSSPRPWRTAGYIEKSRFAQRVARFSKPKCCSHIRKSTKSIFARAAFLLRHAGPCGLLFAGTLVVAMTKGDYIL